MAEKAAYAPGAYPDKCALANAWHYRTGNMESPDCPFGSCLRLYLPGLSGVPSYSSDILRTVHLDGCRQRSPFATLDFAGQMAEAFPDATDTRSAYQEREK